MPTMTDPIRIAVVGHTNAGKTSLLRTLTRNVDFGEVSDRPGTTRHAESIDLRMHGQTAVRFFDTPGLEDSIALLDYLNSLPGSTRPERASRLTPRRVQPTRSVMRSTGSPSSVARLGNSCSGARPIMAAT